MEEKESLNSSAILISVMTISENIFQMPVSKWDNIFAHTYRLVSSFSQIPGICSNGIVVLSGRVPPIMTHATL